MESWICVGDFNNNTHHMEKIGGDANSKTRLIGLMRFSRIYKWRI